MKLLRSVPFLAYYVRLRLAVLFGIYYTAMPLGIAWRWRHWHDRHSLHGRH